MMAMAKYHGGHATFLNMVPEKGHETIAYSFQPAT